VYDGVLCGCDVGEGYIIEGGVFGVGDLEVVGGVGGF